MIPALFDTCGSLVLLTATKSTTARRRFLGQLQIEPDQHC
jgi:hypothetical protein